MQNDGDFVNVILL